LGINEVVIGTAFGILLGPLCAGVVEPRSWNPQTSRVTLEISRVVLVTSLFAIGVDLPKAYMHHHIKGLLVMVVPTAIGWFIVAGESVTHPSLTASFLRH
jgi:NhaP-type Na+/H+ or K+/H+ antiporter